MRITKKQPHVYFNFSEQAQNTMLGILGESDDCFNMIYNIECGINMVFLATKKHKHLLTPKEQRKKIETIQDHTLTLLESLLSVTLKSESDYNFGAKDLSTFNAICMNEWMEKRKTLPKGPTLSFATGEEYDNTVLNAVKSLEKLADGCEYALKSLPAPKQGDRSKYENQLYHFDLSCITGYMLTFNCLPATSRDSAFIQCMQIIYNEAKFPTSNVLTRMRKAKKEKEKEISSPERLAAIQTRKGIHPPKRIRLEHLNKYNLEG